MRQPLPVRLLVIGAAIAASIAGAAATRQTAEATAFGARVEALSERGGYFDTDNLISNEQSYLMVLPDLRKRGLQGGAYIGVGPDQNFSYIAALRPDVAFIVDIRRDNLLLHLLFKALFATSPTRIEYLSHLTGRRPPADPSAWSTRNIGDIVAFVQQAPALDAAGRAALASRLRIRIATFGVKMTAEDVDTTERFHERFQQNALELQFQSFGRAPQRYYPTLRQLLLETDGSGQQASFLASEARYETVRSLQAKDLIVPVTGDLAGPTAIRAIGAHLRANGQSLTAFYTSNVEFYLYRGGAYQRFLENLAALPHGRNAVVIRSIFGGGGGSVSETEAVDDLLSRSRR